MTDPVDDGLDTALEQVIAAARLHLDAVRAGAEDPIVEAAYRELNNASSAYDELLFETYDEVTPWQADSLAALDLDRDGRLGASPVPGGNLPTVDSLVMGDGMVIAVRQRRDFVVSDLAALLQAGTRARAAQGSAADADDEGFDATAPVSEVGEAVYELVQAAGGALTGLDVAELEAGNGVLMVNAVNTVLDLSGDPGAGEDDLPFVCGPGTRMLLRIDEEILPEDLERELPFQSR